MVMCSSVASKIKAGSPVFDLCISASCLNPLVLGLHPNIIKRNPPPSSLHWKNLNKDEKTAATKRLKLPLTVTAPAWQQVSPIILPMKSAQLEQTDTARASRVSPSKYSGRTISAAVFSAPSYRGEWPLCATCQLSANGRSLLQVNRLSLATVKKTH